MSEFSVDAEKLSKLAEIQIDHEEKLMLEKHVNEWLKTANALLKIETGNVAASTKSRKSHTRPDETDHYDQIENLDISVPRMVHK